MFLRINKYKTIKTKDLIGIFDADSATMGSDSRKFLTKSEKEHRLISCGGDIPKSFVLYSEEKSGKLSPNDKSDNSNNTAKNNPDPKNAKEYRVALMKFSSNSVKNKIEAEEKLMRGM